MTERSRLMSYHPEEALRHLLENIKRLIENPRIERNMLVALSKEVQDQVDKTRELTGVVASVDQGVKALTAQVTELKAAVASAASLSAEDKAALTQGVTDTQGLIDTLKADIPANTPAESAPTEPAPPVDGQPVTP